MKLYRPSTGLLSALCISLLSACVSTSVTTNISDSLPCWIESPTSTSGIGQIGLAQPIAVGSQTPEQISQIRALAALCTSSGEQCSQETLITALESNRLLGKPVHLASHRSSDRVFGYAGFTPPNAETCEPSACNISQCDPAWLCSPSLDKKTGLLGVSYRATNAQAQYDSAIRNALLQAEYMYGVDVTASKRIKSVTGGIGNYQLLYTNDQVDMGEQETLAYYMAKQCRDKSTLFTHVVIEKRLEDKVRLDADDTAWILNPKYKGVDGAVGMVEKLTASGLVSEQIELAIKRAAVELAYEKFSHIAENTEITLKNNGHVLVSMLTENTETELKARVIKIHFLQNDNQALKVYAWLGVQ